MKRKSRNRGAKKHKNQLGTLLIEKPGPPISEKRKREAKARAAANRRAFLCMAIGLAGGATLFAIVLALPPRISPEQLAADVKAQCVYKIGEGLSANAADPVPSAAPSYDGNPHRMADALSTNNPIATRGGGRNYPLVSFESLSAFRFFVTDQMLDKASDSLTAFPSCLGQIPREVRALNGKDVSIRGFMMPMKYEGKLATEFLLMRNQSLCCYGKAPRITEWVNVRMAGKGVKPIMDELVTVFGIFYVGAVRENGQLVGIYRLDADKLKGPRE
jgi:hypothetical protein